MPSSSSSLTIRTTSTLIKPVDFCKVFRLNPKKTQFKPDVEQCMQVALNDFSLKAHKLMALFLVHIRNTHEAFKDVSSTGYFYKLNLNAAFVGKMFRGLNFPEEGTNLYLLLKIVYDHVDNYSPMTRVEKQRFDRRRLAEIKEEKKRAVEDNRDPMLTQVVEIVKVVAASQKEMADGQKETTKVI